MSLKPLAVSYGPPIVVPGSARDDWTVMGIDTNRGRPAAALVRGMEGGDGPSPDVPLPLTLTVAESESSFLVDGELVPAQLLSTERAWRLTAAVDGRMVPAAGPGSAPEGLEVSRLLDIEAVPNERFRQRGGSSRP